MARYPYCTMLMVLFLQLLNLRSVYSHCKEHRCGSHGPVIRFPFYLIDGKTNYSDYPTGFGVSCKDKSETMLELPAFPSPVLLQVQEINYMSQYITLTDPTDCLPMQFLKINQSSIFHSHFEVETGGSVTFFNCSSSSEYQRGCPIQVIGSSNYITMEFLKSCSKMFDTAKGITELDELRLRWSKPNSTYGEIECSTSQFRSTILIAAGGIIGPILVILAFFYIYKNFKAMGEEDQARVEKFLEDYISQKPTRFSYADIKRITNGFKYKLGQGAYGAVFKGKLSEKIIVAVKILNNSEGDGKEFINEVGTLGKIHHVNVIRLLGFCADGVHRAFIYDYFPHGCLQNFISSPDNKQIFLGWEKLEQIALGVAKGIEYLHQGCDQRIFHFDINPYTILLSDDFTPKIIDFGLAKSRFRNRNTMSMITTKRNLDYTASEVFFTNFGHDSYKSNIYSYGMLLLEMIGGRKDKGQSHETEILYPEWIYNLVEETGDIRIRIDNEGDIRIAKKLATVGLWCIQWHPNNLPSIRNVLQMMEGEGDKLRVPPNPFDSTTSTSSSAIIPVGVGSYT